jgi:hypothetical protein
LSDKLQKLKEVVASLDWADYKVEFVDSLPRGAMGCVFADEKLVQIRKDALASTAVHENVHVHQHVWMDSYLGQEEKLRCVEEEKNLPYIIRPMEALARMVQFKNISLEQSMDIFKKFYSKNRKQMLVAYCQRQVRRAVELVFKEIGAEEPVSMLIRENGIELIENSGQSIIALFAGRGSTKPMLATEAKSVRFYESGKLLARTSADFRSAIEGFVNSIPYRV